MATLFANRGGALVAVQIDDQFFHLTRRNWYISSKGYVRRDQWTPTKERKADPTLPKHRAIYLHRLVTNCDDCLTVDHLNGDKLDNRLSNLERVDVATNTRRQWALLRDKGLEEYIDDGRTINGVPYSFG